MFVLHLIVPRQAETKLKNFSNHRYFPASNFSFIFLIALCKPFCTKYNFNCYLNTPYLFSTRQGSKLELARINFPEYSGLIYQTTCETKHRIIHEDNN